MRGGALIGSRGFLQMPPGVGMVPQGVGMMPPGVGMAGQMMGGGGGGGGHMRAGDWYYAHDPPWVLRFFTFLEKREESMWREKERRSSTELEGERWIEGETEGETEST